MPVPAITDVGAGLGEHCAELWADGGCVNVNPSPIGGTWAFLYVADGAEFLRRSGTITPDELGLPEVENNVTELLAIVLGLETLPAGWSGTVFSDSLNALRRVGNPRVAKFGGVPTWLRERTVAAVDRLGQFSNVLIGGHPTKAELAKGERKDGKPCSVFNVRCDALCKAEAAHLLKGKQ